MNLSGQAMLSQKAVRRMKINACCGTTQERQEVLWNLSFHMPTTFPRTRLHFGLLLLLASLVPRQKAHDWPKTHILHPESRKQLKTYFKMLFTTGHLIFDTSTFSFSGSTWKLKGWTMQHDKRRRSDHDRNKRRRSDHDRN